MGASDDIAEPGSVPQPAAVRFDSRARNRELAATLAHRARRSLALFTADLEAAVYDDAEFIAAVVRLATTSPRTEVRVLVRDPTAAVKQGHRLIETARRFTSAIHLHRAAPEHRELPESFLVADERGCLYKPVPGRFEGEAAFAAGARCRELLKQFDEMWGASAPDPELRRLHI